MKQGVHDRSRPSKQLLSKSLSRLSPENTHTHTHMRIFLSQCTHFADKCIYTYQFLLNSRGSLREGTSRQFSRLGDKRVFFGQIFRVYHVRERKVAGCRRGCTEYVCMYVCMWCITLERGKSLDAGGSALNVCVHVCMYVCKYVRERKVIGCRRRCTEYVCVYVHVYACMHACMHACMYVVCICHSDNCQCLKF